MHETYSSQFFGDVNEGARASAAAMVPLVIELVQPASVIDVGCGTGVWLSVFREHGVEEIQGIDGDWVQPAELVIPRQAFSAVDLAASWPVTRRFDLAVSLEVAEHLPATSAELFVETLTRSSDAVLFSAAVPGQGGTHHINEQWPEYWAAFFEERGYVPIDALRHRFWDDDRVKWWYAQNTLLYVTSDLLSQRPALGAARDATRGRPLRIVHPALYTQTLQREPPGLSLGATLRGLPRLISNSIRSRLG